MYLSNVCILLSCRKFWPTWKFHCSTFYRCVEKVPKNVLAKCDACIDDPCKNGGTCQRMKGRTFSCKCAARYHGKYCENKIDACYGEPCLNNATCKVLHCPGFLSLFACRIDSLKYSNRYSLKCLKYQRWTFRNIKILERIWILTLTFFLS